MIAIEDSSRLLFPPPAMSVRACCESFRVPGRRNDRREATTSASDYVESMGDVGDAPNMEKILFFHAHDFSRL